MPTYEYVCEHCGYEFELMQRITEPPRERCPKCRHKVKRKLGRGAGIIFKGSGFYSTDYRSPEYQAKAKAERPSEGKEAAGSSGSKEPKKGSGSTGSSSSGEPKKAGAGGDSGGA